MNVGADEKARKKSSEFAGILIKKINKNSPSYHHYRHHLHLIILR